MIIRLTIPDLVTYQSQDTWEGEWVSGNSTGLHISGPPHPHTVGQHIAPTSSQSTTHLNSTSFAGTIRFFASVAHKSIYLKIKCRIAECGAECVLAVAEG